MALDYLYNNKNKRVLVITTNALVKKASTTVNPEYSEYGQFLRDWYKKLPFKQLNLDKRIDIVNNHYSNLANKHEYGLIIVDEAQLFLSEHTKRYTNLCEINADKIVFLTATPIKDSEKNLEVYVNIANNVTRKDNPDENTKSKLSCDWIKNIDTSNKKTDEIISSKFDLSSPVTRYFKDTIMAINVKGYEKHKARRLIPELWVYGENGTTKKQILLNKINTALAQDSKNRFVIFTRFVEKEANVIGTFLSENGFEHFEQKKDEYSPSFKIITGNNGYELSNFNGTTNLPTVLILTYQIAEQGVNLPGFNHVINYHISAFPSALEQRFGRIDRMGKNGSIYNAIKMCFLISNTTYDSNTLNFYCATSLYLNNLISCLPSKNTILTSEIIEKYFENAEHLNEYANKLNNLINEDAQLDLAFKYFKVLEKQENTKDVPYKFDPMLYKFIKDNDIEIDLNSDEAAAKKSFKKSIKNQLEYCERDFNATKKLSADICKKAIDTFGDKIFYCIGKKNPKTIDEKDFKTIDAIEGCARNISNNASFISFRNEFQKKVKLPILFKKYSTELNSYFEELFVKNSFNDLFPYNGYKKTLCDILKDKNIRDIDKQTLLDNDSIVINNLPVFKMFHEYKRILQNMAFNKKGEIRQRFDYNPFIASYERLVKLVREDIAFLGLSKDFADKYFLSNISDYSKFFKLEIDANHIAQASNWYKLAYHFTRKEAACLMNYKNLYKEDNENFYYMKDRYIHLLAEYYAVYLNNGNSDQEFVKDCEDCEKILQEFLEKEKTEKGKHQSLFNHFIFNNLGEHRSYSMLILDENCSVDIRDIWTQGIFYEIKGKTVLNATLDKVAKLPEKFSGYSLY